MQIQQQAALYSRVGIVYGGNGATAFQAPNLMNRFPLGSITLGNSSPNPARNAQNGGSGGSLFQHQFQLIPSGGQCRISEAVTVKQ